MRRRIHGAAPLPPSGRVTMSQGGLSVRVSRRTLLRTVPALLSAPALMLGMACRAPAPAPAAPPAAPPTAQGAGASTQAAPATAAPAAPAAQAPAAAPPT